jgi:hypothetical protein
MHVFAAEPDVGVGPVGTVVVLGRALVLVPGGVTARPFGWAGEKVAGGIGVGHRVGVVDVEDQGQVLRGSAPVARASCRMRSRRMCSRERAG